MAYTTDAKQPPDAGTVHTAMKAGRTMSKDGLNLFRTVPLPAGLPAENEGLLGRTQVEGVSCSGNRIRFDRCYWRPLADGTYRPEAIDAELDAASLARLNTVLGGTITRDPPAIAVTSP